MIDINHSEEKNLKLDNEINNQKNKFSTDRIDISFGELLNLYKDNELIIRPEYQRYFRWTDRQKTALIESLLLSIPIPPIFVFEDSQGKWEVIDGLQRLSTIITFFGLLDIDNNIIRKTDDLDNTELEDEDNNISLENFWKLSSGDLIRELEGLNIKTLPDKYRLNLKRAGCRVEILRGKDREDMKYELFKRLNSAGSQLTPQEIRNAIYRGINPQINKLIEELSGNENFINLVQISEKQKQELYDQELILRFIAFSTEYKNIKGNTEKCLDNFMKNAVQDENFNVEKYREIFINIFSTLSTLSPNIFKGQKVFSPTIFEGITIGLANNIEKFKNNPELSNKAIQKLKSDAEFKNSCKYSNPTSRKNRIDRAINIFTNFE